MSLSWPPRSAGTNAAASPRRSWPAPAEAGSASGALSAVQQLAAAIGSAVVTTVYFSQQHQHGSGHAMTVAVAVVGAITVACLGLVWLLPKKAPADGPGPA